MIKTWQVEKLVSMRTGIKKARKCVGVFWGTQQASHRSHLQIVVPDGLVCSSAVRLWHVSPEWPHCNALLQSRPQQSEAILVPRLSAFLNLVWPENKIKFDTPWSPDNCLSIMHMGLIEALVSECRFYVGLSSPIAAVQEFGKILRSVVFQEPYVCSRNLRM